MRVSLALVLAATLFCGTALAQQFDSPGQGSGLGPGQARPPAKTLEPPSTAACDPTFGGRYSQLIRQLPIPEDEGQYGRCHDYGAWNGTEYKGHANLPPNAFWTYSAPNWYVWARQGGAPRQ